MNLLQQFRNMALENIYFKKYHDKCLVAEDREFIDTCIFLRLLVIKIFQLTVSKFLTNSCIGI